MTSSHRPNAAKTSAKTRAKTGAKTAERRTFGRARKLPSGRWQAFYNDPDGRMALSRTGKPTPVRHSAPYTFTTKGDAEAWLVDERRLISAGTWTPPAERRAAAAAEAERRKALLFGPYAERWVRDRRNSRGQPLALGTRDKYLSLLEHHILPMFGDLPLDEITREKVRRWYSGRRLAKTPTARAHAYNLLRAILRTAVDEDELLDKNPAYIRGAGVRHRSKDVVPATADELDTIVEAMPERLRLLILLAAWCALRSGELRELRRSDVVLGKDEDGEPYGWLRVRRGVVRVRGDRDEHAETTEDAPRMVSHVGKPKTAAGVRDVAIPPFLLPQVREHLLQHAAPGRDGLLFTNRDGGHLSSASLWGRATTFTKDGKVARKGWGYHEARRAAGRDDLTIHDLRHTGASMAGEEGASMAELMHRLGHSTPSMAMLYQHSTKTRDLALARRLSARAAGTSVPER